ncbi:MAG: phosphonate C-P lyase system protein PhnG [Alphaproteobacteria bacterium]|nr:phosphonate C-P lyase system protein PhnG [Alphaproteobacteria bacterium]
MTEIAATQAQRRAALARLFALADWTLARELTEPFAGTAHHVVRGPETGLVMLRGRMGSTGAAFNFGEATATRCSVRLADKTEGHAYVLGRNGELARRMALCDALLQQPEADMAAFDKIAQQMDEAIAARRSAQAAKVAATKVDFFTVVRGDG